MSGAATAQARVPTPRAEPTDLKLEVVVIPVADVDRALAFYGGLGWRLDADFRVREDFRAVQMTPPGSPCSIHFGKGISAATPGSAQGMYLVVDDLEAARTDLIARGAAVSEPFHFESIGGPPVPGIDPNRGSYSSHATFKDPDGNAWLLQEVGTRLPGRGLSNDVKTLVELLRETEERHGPYERDAPKHHWSEWYAGYMIARERGKTPDDAAAYAASRIAATVNPQPTT
jgi:catechol 2,3-dioxygenase-like lactoylglutathione lyase family enzyme